MTKKPQAPPADAILDEQHCRAIEAVVPHAVITPEAWAELEAFLEGYPRMNEARRRILADKRRWQRIGKFTDSLAADIRGLKRGLPWTGRDPEWPNRVLQFLRQELWLKAEARREFADTQRLFRGQANPHRELLYWGVLGVWTNHLGGELSYSRKADGTVRGPLIRYLQAVLQPVLGDDMPAAGLADIVDRERAGRRRLRSESKRYRRRVRP